MIKKQRHICNCGNQHLLHSGETCEICMGQAPSQIFIEEWPEMSTEDPFDELYFEELETYFDTVEFAA